MYYNLFGPKWGDRDYGTESGEITWSAEFGSNFQFDGDDTQAEFDQALQDAFDAWETVANINFTYVSPDDTTTHVDVNVGVDAIDGREFGTVGEATWNSMNSSIYLGTVTFDEAEDWAPDGDGGGINFFDVALHEIGHVLGLKHYDSVGDDPLQIMNASISRSLDGLQSGDIAGAQVLYGEGDGVAPPPPPPAPPPPPPPPPPEDEPVTEPPAEEETDPPAAPEIVAEDDGGGGGSAGVIVALLGALVALLFGGGTALMGVAAGRVAQDDGADEDDTAGSEPDVLATDLLPVFESSTHYVHVDDFGNFIAHPDHEHGCDCGHCCGADEDMFVI